MTIEKWKTISFAPSYKVSSKGRVMSLIRGKLIMKPTVLQRTGYEQVHLSNRKKYSVHRLVALHFCKGHESHLQVNHKNGVKTDNRAENLEWVTHSENIQHAFRVLGAKTPYKGKTGLEHSTSKPCASVNIDTGRVIVFENASRATDMGFDSGSISRCARGISEYHKGHYWHYLTRHQYEAMK